MPMSSFPELHELVWLFEVQPAPMYDDLPWPIGEVLFTTRRGSWEIRCSIGIYDYTVELDCLLDGVPTIHLRLNQAVDSLEVDRLHDAEALVIRPRANVGLGDVRLQLKPCIRLSGETVLPWER